LAALRARQAEEQLNTERLQSYKARNSLQFENDEAKQRLRSLEQQLSGNSEELELQRKRVAEAHERKHASDRQTGEQAERIAQLEQSLEAANQMFERTKAELVRIEEGAEQRIAESRQLAEALIQQSAMAGDAKLREVEQSHARKLEQARAEAQEHLSGLERLAAEKLEEAKASAQARLDELESTVHGAVEARTAAEARARELEDRIADLTAKAAEAATAADTSEELEQVKADARQKIGIARDKVKAALEAHEAAEGRIAGLEQEIERLRQDNKSFEAQINDLLAEAKARPAPVAMDLDVTAPGHRATAASGEPVASQSELDAIRAELEAVRDERDGMATEMQRLTDELHRKAERSDTVPVSSAMIHEETVIDAPFVALPKDPPRPTTTSGRRKPSSKDTLGRDIEPSIEELEDLLAIKPPPPPRR
jgi:chromosome segregation ATPase